MKISGIYQILNKINGKSYIGSSINIKSRFHDHLKNLRRNTHDNIHLQRSWNKHGECNFIFEMIEPVSSVKNLIAREQWWIDNTENKYNILKIAGSCLGMKLSDETKLKISISRLGRFKGKDNPFYGRRHEQETIDRMKKKLSIMMSGENNPFYGKKHSKKSKKLLSDKLTGRKMSAEFSNKQLGNERRAQSYKVTFPDKSEKIIFNLSKFCSQYNFHRTTVYTAVTSGKQYRGHFFKKL